jgi:hypothetical protein
MRHLNTDVSFCELDGRLFFLDLAKDRYFQLSEAMERKFLGYLESPDGPNVDVSELGRHHLLAGIPSIPADGSASEISPPDQSALEPPCTDTRVSLDAVLDVFLIVAMTYWQLKTMRLKPVLQALSEYRRSRTSPPLACEAECQRRLRGAAAAYNRVRRYVPIETCCLIDSLSMVRFLAKRHLRAHVVMAIACDPFSAHAWVQLGSLVLNETLGAAQAHVPIRVI